MEITQSSEQYKRSQKHIFLTLIVVFILNLLVIAGVITYVLVVFGTDFLLANIPQNLWLILLGAFVGVTLSLWYVRDLIAFFVRDPNDVIEQYSLNRLRRKALNLPVIFAGISFLTRIIFGTIIARNVMELHPDQSLRIFIHIFMGVIFSAQVAAIYVFYFAESILSSEVVPLLMGEEKVSALDGVIPMPVYGRVILMVLTTAVFPMLHIVFLNYLGESQGPTLLYATGLVFINGIGQGIFIVKSISIPIGQIAELFLDFQKGEDVSRDTEIYRADDLGRFAEMFDDLAETIEERDFIRQTFGRYMSQQVMEEILNGQIELGGSRKNATVMFTDVRDFTNLSENKQPEEVVELLNDYLDTMVQVITSNEGIPDKFLGDGILAVWGVPANINDHRQKAVKSAFDMLEKLDNFNEIRRRKGQEPISIGTGIHSGELIAGNIGSSKKMEFTVIGDTVNTCSRIETVNKELNSLISISGDVYHKLNVDYRDRFDQAPEIDLKGKDETIQIYTYSANSE